jgi:hypothetical protein
VPAVVSIVGRYKTAAMSLCLPPPWFGALLHVDVERRLSRPQAGAAYKARRVM